MLRSLHHPAQGDFFDRPVFETRQQSERLDIDLFRLRLKQAMSAAIRDSKRSREQIVESVGRAMGAESFSRGMLDAYTSPAKAGHDISVVRFKALARVLRAPKLWDIAVSDDGLIVLQGDEARLAEIARLQQAQRELGSRIRALRAVPVDIKRGG